MLDAPVTQSNIARFIVDGGGPGRETIRFEQHALYLGEINDSQQEAWRKTIEIFEEGQARPRTVALFPEERIGAVADEKGKTATPQ